jgi:hypothetical protein
VIFKDLQMPSWKGFWAAGGDCRPGAAGFNKESSVFTGPTSASRLSKKFVGFVPTKPEGPSGSSRSGGDYRESSPPFLRSARAGLSIYFVTDEVAFKEVMISPVMFFPPQKFV